MSRTPTNLYGALETPEESAQFEAGSSGVQRLACAFCLFQDAPDPTPDTYTVYQGTILCATHLQTQIQRTSAL